MDMGVASGMGSVSLPARVAAADEAISADELQLAARNHGLPLEALRFDVTPTGLHYLLTHYDIPAIDPSGFRLTIDGLVDTPLSLDLEAIRRRPRRSRTVTLECAGNGRAGLLPRPVSQPWLVEAVGTARLDRHSAGGPAAGGGPHATTRSRSSSPARTTGSSGAWNRTTSAVCRWRSACGTTCCWRTR